MSGFAALDMDTQEALHPGDVGAQAEATYGAILELLAHAGLGPRRPRSRPSSTASRRRCPTTAAVAGVRERLLRPPWPASTGAICAGLLRPEFLLEVFPTAVYPRMSLLTDELRALIGHAGASTPRPEPFGPRPVRYFAHGGRRRQPALHRRRVARAHGLRRRDRAADADLRDQPVRGPARWTTTASPATRGTLDVPGTRQVRGGNSYTFHRRVRPDDVVTATWEIRDLTEKTTRAGQRHARGRSSRATYTNQHGELLAVNEETIVLVSLDGGR